MTKDQEVEVAEAVEEAAEVAEASAEGKRSLFDISGRLHFSFLKIASAEDQEEVKKVLRVKSQKVVKKSQLLTKLRNKQLFSDTQTLCCWEDHQKEVFIQYGWMLRNNFNSILFMN